MSKFFNPDLFVLLFHSKIPLGKYWLCEWIIVILGRFCTTLIDIYFHVSSSYKSPIHFIHFLRFCVWYCLFFHLAGNSLIWNDTFLNHIPYHRIFWWLGSWGIPVTFSGLRIIHMIIGDDERECRYITHWDDCIQLGQSLPASVPFSSKVIFAFCDLEF